jgi:ATP-dependent Clp protease ATP-binding subunit ClpC
MNGYNFTERVRRILAMAREEAARLHHEYVGTEHILLGLVRDGEGVAAEVLRGLGVDREAIRQHVLEGVHPGRPGSVPGPDLPYTSRAKKVLELSMTEASMLNHSYVGSEHLLLGLLAEEKGIAAQVLSQAGVRLDAARARVVQVLGGTEPQWLAPSINGEEPAELKGKPVERVEVVLYYRGGRQLRGSFGSPHDAVVFLNRWSP